MSNARKRALEAVRRVPGLPDRNALVPDLTGMADAASDVWERHLLGIRAVADDFNLSYATKISIIQGICEEALDG